MKQVMSVYLDIDCQEISFTAFLACNVLFVSNHTEHNASIRHIGDFRSNLPRRHLPAFATGICRLDNTRPNPDLQRLTHLVKSQFSMKHVKLSGDR